MNEIVEITEKNRLQELITRGGDERITLNESGKNRYNINPAEYKGLFNRGSCTSSTINDETEVQLKNTLARIKEVGFNEIRKEHERRIKKLINFEGQDKFEILFAPSGSDLCYFSLLFAVLTHPGEKIINIVTCPEELGTGSMIASRGLYHMHKNQFDEDVPYGKSFTDNLNIEIRSFPARDDKGLIIDHKEAMKETITHEYGRQSVIGNLVIGSKSGIEDNIEIINEVKEDILWTVDLCQFRSAKLLLNKLLDLNVMVMITGSKFYQSPPFSGAMLVPKTIMNKIKSVRPALIEPFRKVLSCHDLPDSMAEVKQHLNPHENVGLLLRWEAALYEMEAFDKTDIIARNEVIDEWNSVCMKAIEKFPFEFELMPNQEETNKTIISFRVKHADGTYLQGEELKVLFKSIVKDKFDSMNNGFDRVFFGQPVDYLNRSFIRLALGSYNIRMLLKNGRDYSNELALIDIIRNRAKELF